MTKAEVLVQDNINEGFCIYDFGDYIMHTYKDDSQDFNYKKRNSYLRLVEELQYQKLNKFNFYYGSLDYDSLDYHYLIYTDFKIWGKYVYNDNNRLKIKDIMKYIINMIEKGIIPKRYTPHIQKKIIEENHHNNHIDILYVYTFKESIISLMIQKKLNKKVIAFFQELTKTSNGLNHEKYIDKWYKSLIKKNWYFKAER